MIFSEPGFWTQQTTIFIGIGVFIAVIATSILLCTRLEKAKPDIFNSFGTFALAMFGTIGLALMAVIFCVSPNHTAQEQTRLVEAHEQIETRYGLTLSDQNLKELLAKDVGADSMPALRSTDLAAGSAPNSVSRYGITELYVEGDVKRIQWAWLGNEWVLVDANQQEDYVELPRIDQ